jgi:adenylate cyclase
MRSIARILLIAAGILAGSLIFLLFFTLLVGPYWQWLGARTDFVVAFFRETFLTIVPGVATFGFGLHIVERFMPDDKQKKLQPFDFVGMGLFAFFVLLFVVTYSATPGSFVHRVTSIVPGPLSALAPDLHTFLLWFSFSWLAMAAVVVFKSLGRVGQDRGKIGGFVIAIITSFFFALMLEKVPFMQSLEATALASRYAILRNPGGSQVPGMDESVRYCQAPREEVIRLDDMEEAVVDSVTRGTPIPVGAGTQIQGKDTAVAIAPQPPGVRDDIVIIGISNETFEKTRWPLDWNIYADLIRSLGGAENAILLFDISFVDEKGVYGGEACGTLLQCTPLAGAKMPAPQVIALADAMSGAKAAVVSDYPLETAGDFLKPIASNPQRAMKYKTKLKLMFEQNRLTNVRGGELAPHAPRYTNPAVEPVGRAQDGAGYANIYKDSSGMNWKMPLVSRRVNYARYGEPDYNADKDDIFLPGIDLVVAVRYYGVELKDVEVDFIAGQIRIKNIPERKIEKVNLETMEMEHIDIIKKLPSEGRTVIIPIDHTGQMLINFRGGQYCFPVHELINVTKQTPEEGSQNFKNKIALIAMYYATGASTAQDMHLSPYGDMAGIEHHAYAINTILNQDFAYQVPPLGNLLILLAVGLIMGFYQPRVATGLAFLFAFLIAIGYTALSLGVTFQLLNMVHVLPTVVILQFVQLVGFIGFRVLTEEENVKFIRNTFSKFVSQDVVEELLSNPEAISLGGSKKEISVFFSDVRGFTTISEKLGPEDLVHLLNEYLSEMTELIIEYRGTIDKYMGDAIMAFWGAPARNDDHAYYACVAALAQYHALQNLQKRWSERHIPVLDIGIGINTGLAVVGNMGSSRRMDYTLMGDTVNLGSRLEGATKNYGIKIIISEFTYERVKDRVWARELDLVRVKGKLEPVRIYELMALRNDADMEALKTSNAHKEPGK